jgi:superfamily I DNA/RNA helicase
VGDDDQSIYGWRGAEIGNLLDLEKHYPEVKIIKLEQNYRSTNTILTAANALIKHNVRRRAKQLWSDKGHGAKITLHTFNDDEEEARSVVEQIEFARLARRTPWQDNAILFRTNQQSRPIEMELRRAGVKYHLIGGQSFFDRREIKDFLAYLKTFLNPNDDISLLRIANVPARGLDTSCSADSLAAVAFCSAIARRSIAPTTLSPRGRAAATPRSAFLEPTTRVRSCVLENVACQLATALSLSPSSKYMSGATPASGFQSL